MISRLHGRGFASGFGWIGTLPVGQIADRTGFVITFCAAIFRARDVWDGHVGVDVSVPPAPNAFPVPGSEGWDFMNNIDWPCQLCQPY